MAMTLRLTDEQDQILDAVAEHLHLSRQQAAIRAIEYFNEAVILQADIDAGFEFVMTHDKALMDRLADA
ncbi:MAG: hypothetical protein RLZZ258_796 [Actinomycetota bacterium]|jgi:predicted transcriptional regulator